MNLSIALATFAVMLPAELPDKTMIAAPVLGSKYKPQHVFVGAALAFAAQVVIAVTVGRILSLLPHRLLQFVVATMFAAGAILIIKKRGGKTDAQQKVRRVTDAPPFWKVGATAFTVVFLAEFGDLTQLATANLAAKFSNPLSAGIGSVIALWVASAIGIWGGKNVLRVIPMKLFTGIASFLLAAFALASFIGAFSG